MHKGVIILTKAENKVEAISNVEEFLEPYGDGQVWDWYQVGGRWSNTLAPKHDEFKKWANKFLLEKQKISRPEIEGDWLTQDTVDKNQKELQEKWIALGMIGRNPFSDHYSLPNEGADYDALPLKDCIDIVKNWCQSLEEVKEEYFEKVVEERKKEKETENTGWPMSAYYAKRYAEAAYGDFCFDTSVYDATTGEAETIPENIEEYWAVMIDMHN